MFKGLRAAGFLQAMQIVQGEEHASVRVANATHIKEDAVRAQALIDLMDILLTAYDRGDF